MSYAHLTLKELRGAEYALRLLYTSPVFKGRALEVIKEQHAAVVETANRLGLPIQADSDE